MKHQAIASTSSLCRLALPRCVNAVRAFNSTPHLRAEPQTAPSPLSAAAYLCSTNEVVRLFEVIIFWCDWLIGKIEKKDWSFKLLRLFFKLWCPFHWHISGAPHIGQYWTILRFGRALCRAAAIQDEHPHAAAYASSWCRDVRRFLAHVPRARIARRTFGSAGCVPFLNIMVWLTYWVEGTLKKTVFSSVSHKLGLNQIWGNFEWKIVSNSCA